MARLIRTFTDDWLRRHRETHAQHAAFGTHRHPYLHATMHTLAATIAGSLGEPPSLLDYGCGKGVFIAEMAKTRGFRYIRGYDPAVDAYKARPAQSYDVVVCLDVLDQLEAAFIEPAIQDVAQFTSHTAVFDVITVQTPALAHLNPRSAATWQEIIGRQMRVIEATVRPSTAEEARAGGVSGTDDHPGPTARNHLRQPRARAIRRCGPSP